MSGVNDIRKSFLDFFARNDHQIVASSALVPRNDPTLMFTNAGMVPFKNVFTGLEKRPYSRAVTAQKCVRAGGKHNDLDNVGYTARHHTFFEMLGNFSFGDYFKERAIELAWTLITKDLALPKERLLITVYIDDDDAFRLWKKIAGLPDSKILRIAGSDNFWAMGDTGPCGPCSEIFYDHGDKIPGGPPGSADSEGDRFIEIWNLVFMQYEQLEGGKRVNLPRPSIDTGMGLERIAAVLQGTYDNYAIDLFQTLIRAIAELTGVDPNGPQKASHRVIADHLRASAFLIADGVLPSNEGRGYVLRRIMRRAMRHAELLGAKEPLMWRLVPALTREMRREGVRLIVSDTQKKAGDLFVHVVKVERGSIKVGDPLLLDVDHARRSAIRQNHSATHLLHEALRQVLGDHVAQKGSLVAPDRLRFDFSHPKPMSAEEIERVEDIANDIVLQNAPVTTRLMAVDDAIASGARALFGEKYGDEVRVVAMGEGTGNTMGWSVELCGGTHVRQTGDIGLVSLVGESGVAAGVRRIEALTGKSARKTANKQLQVVKAAAAELKVPLEDMPARIGTLLDERKKLERDLSEAKKKLAMGGGEKAEGDSADVRQVNGVKLLARAVSGIELKDLRSLADEGKRQVGSGVVAIVATAADGKAGIVVGVTDDLTKRFNAVELVKKGAEALGGKGGGGRPDMAQAGGPDGSKAQDALKAIEAALGG
ncbi:MAG: alanine--tRNA ligase [Pseudolabrys sp.]